jgi:type II secretory pathway predicted ATPase ExeA
MASAPTSRWREDPLVVQSTATFVDRDMRRPPNLSKTMTVPEPQQAPADPGPPANYLDLYGLSKPPFGGASEAGGFILFASHRRPFELLIEHVVNGSGIVLLLGEEGIGKTETLRAVADVVAESGLRAIMVSRPLNGRVNLMQFVSALQGQPSAEEATIDEAITRFLAPPRKALLIDDIDLLPGDCVHLLTTLLQRLPNDPNGPAIVLSSATDLAAVSNRPELSQFVSSARNTIRLLRLGSAEVRQYIERSLWVSGGTTRRLIAADAMKLLVARSGGVPGVTNRLMEAVLTAGFARGDSMITAKTVSAAMGPATPRPRRQPSRPPGVAGRAMQVVAVGLLVLGSAVFLYRGLSGRLNPVTSKPITLESSPVAVPSPAPPPPARQAESLPPGLMAALVKRGDQSLALGDIAAARLLYQRAAEAGSAPAAIALAKTYDPNYTAPGSKPDPAHAAEWYRKGIALGDSRAADLLKQLGSH